MASSNSPTSNWSAPRSRSRAVRSERAASSLRCMASTLSNVDDDTARQDVRSIIRLALQHRDLPFVDRRATAEGLCGLIANRSYRAGARTHRLFVLPRSGRNATTGATVDQQRHTKTAVDFFECGHDYIADMRDPGVDGRRLRLDSGRARVHETTLFARR